MNEQGKLMQNNYVKSLTAYAARAAFGVALCLSFLPVQATAKDVFKEKIIKNYADIAHATYEDSLITARKLQSAIDAFLKSPSAATLDAAKEAWLNARVPYQKTEVFRFGNVIVDEWEGKVNAWPLDEGLIDYVSTDYGTESYENK